MTYRKIPIIVPGLIFIQKAFCWAYFRGSLFSEGIIIGRNFAFQNGLGLTIKTAENIFFFLGGGGGGNFTVFIQHLAQ